MQFEPEEARALCEAYELATSTFNRTRKLRRAEREQVARAVIQASGRVSVLQPERLAAAALLTPVMRRVRPGARQGRR
jgi:hypothetical protein